MEILQKGGLMAVYKPQGWTSQDVVGKIKWTLKNYFGKKIKIKVGHGGTLDPMATGVLVIGIGSGCKKLQDYIKGGKCYEAIGRFGFSTTTEDSTGEVIKKSTWNHIDNKLIKDIIPKFIGDIEQIPPMYSALKKDGKRLYELARKGEVIERTARKIHIYDIKLLRRKKDMLKSEFRIDVCCGGGTYIRTLICDISKEMNTLGHMTSLLRTKQGPFMLSNCLKEKYFGNPEVLLSHLGKSEKIYKK